MQRPGMIFSRIEYVVDFVIFYFKNQKVKIYLQHRLAHCQQTS